ncbi:unnamed protein product [Caenorhabditis auriculariae]|uniref:G-protein coupled receptors family 1 profile domain-containing protein n=1 Tax=Caenorhabditis auriculariae TaxID=2777116 RepID=A0A8S1HR31_9PELO|nr:unnamed protein product [Caenorhabditis auriculariae]
MFLWGKCFLPVFLLAMIGNFLNLVVYNSDHIRYYIAIRMLCTRLLMNTLTMVFLLPYSLRISEVWEHGSVIDEYFWQYYPYQLCFVNLFGFCAMWLTVLMTGECYLHVFFPSHSKSWCTKRNLSRSYLVIFSAATVLAIFYPLNRTATLDVHCGRVVVTIVASEDSIYEMLERIHTVVSLVAAILAPMGLLVFMTSSIVWKLLLRRSDFPNTSHFTAEKRCVTRITLITTSLQLLAELPPVPVFVYASVIGPLVTNIEAVCIWNTLGVFLGLCNISLSFFVYIVFSEKFRQLVKTRLGEMFCKCGSAQSRITQYGATSGTDPKITTNLLIKPPKSTENSCCTDTYLINERSSAAEDAFL